MERCPDTLPKNWTLDHTPNPKPRHDWVRVAVWLVLTMMCLGIWTGLVVWLVH